MTRFLSFLVLFCLPLVASAQEQVLDEIVAVVGNRIVLRSEVDGLVYNAQQRGTPYSDALWQQALSDLIDQQVMVMTAQKDTTITVTPEQVRQAVDRQLDQMTQQVGGAMQLEEAYGKSTVQIREDLRKTFGDRLLAEQLQQRKIRTIRVTPSEVQAWFDRIPADSLPTLPTTVRVAHIARYLEPSERAVRDAVEVITTLRDSIATGKVTLEDMAKQFSEDQGSAQEGGRISDIRIQELVPEFGAMASRLPLDSLSAPFRTIFGYHILRVNDRRGDVVDFSHILIRVDESSAQPGPAIEYLSTVRDSILTQNLPFELMARRHSEDPSSSQLGGRVVDPRTRNRDLPVEALGPQWQTTLATLEEGDLSEPAAVQLLNGRRAYHIVLLQRRTPSHRVNVETDYEQLEQIALQDKQNTELREWLDELRSRVYIDLRGKAQALMAQR